MSEVTKAISEILGELGATKQDGQNSYQKFKYTSYDEFNAQIKPLLKKRGVAIYPSTKGVISHNVIGKTSSGKDIFGIVVEMEFTVSCGGEDKVFGWVAQGRCESGKEIAKAQTEGMKRFEMKLFHASTKNDIDPDGEDIQVSGKGQKQAPQKKVAPAAATPNDKQMQIIKKVKELGGYEQLNAKTVNDFLQEQLSFKGDFMKANDKALDGLIKGLDA